MDPTFPANFADKAYWFFADGGRMALFLICLGAPLLFYLTVWQTGRRRKARYDLAVFYPPRGLAPAALRYVYKMECDAKCVIVSLINAASKNCYRIRWFKNGFVARKEPFANFENLSGGEKRALSFSRGNYWEQISISKKTSPKTRKMQHKLSAYLRKRHRRFFQRRTGSIVVGILISVFSILGFMLISGGSEIFSFAALYLLVASLFLFLPIFLISVSLQDRYWYGLLLSVLVVGAGIFFVTAIDSYPANPLFSMLVLPVMGINIFFIRILPTWSQEGNSVLKEIESYKIYLERKLTELQFNGQSLRSMQGELPYLMALDLDLKFGPYFRQLLSQTEYDPFQSVDSM